MKAIQQSFSNKTPKQFLQRRRSLKEQEDRDSKSDLSEDSNLESDFSYENDFEEEKVSNLKDKKDRKNGKQQLELNHQIRNESLLMN